MHYPLFSIIIPSKDRPQSLKACLESVVVACQALQSYLAAKDRVYEIIVCDDGLSPDARTLLQAFRAVRYLEGPHQGPAANRNAGAKASQGIWLIFIDDDCIANPEWLLELYKHTARSQALEGCIHPTAHFEDL